MSQLKFKQRGFTLIELLVVIAIIGVLSTLAVVSFGSARAKARDAQRIAQIKQLQTSLELYYADNSSYPKQGGAGEPASALELGTCTGADCEVSVNALTNLGFGLANANDVTTVYMPKISGDPSKTSLNAQNYSYPGFRFCSTADVGSTTCEVAGTETGTSYAILFRLETNTSGLSAGANRFATPNGMQ